MSMVKARWAAKQRPGLPDAREWSTTLALALTQSLVGLRPAAQLNRWMAEEVLVAISIYQRRSLSLHGVLAIPTALRSVRIQHPDPEVAEVSAHAVIGRRSAALAFRLEALGRPLVVHCPGAWNSDGARKYAPATSRGGVQLAHERRLD